MKNSIYYLLLGADKNDNPALIIATCTDKIGVYDFQELPLVNGFQIHCCNLLLRELFPQFEISFENYSQYAELIEKCCFSLCEVTV